MSKASSHDSGSAFTLLKSAIGEVEGVFSPSTFQDLEHICEKLSKAKSVVCYGVGREGLVMKSLTMRLMHAGIHSYFVGDMNVPPVGNKDLFLVSAGPGHFSTVEALSKVASESGSEVVTFTAQKNSVFKVPNQYIVNIPARTMANDLDKNVTQVLPMGSLYEVALFLYFEILILHLRDYLKESANSMRERHTNLE